MVRHLTSRYAKVTKKAAFMFLIVRVKPFFPVAPHCLIKRVLMTFGNLKEMKTEQILL